MDYAMHVYHLCWFLLSSSPYAAHIDAFRQHFSDLLANRPTGRPSIEKWKQNLKINYKNAKENIKKQKPGKDATNEAKKSYQQARDDVSWPNWIPA